MEVSQLLDTRARLVVVPAEVATPGVWWSLWTDIRWPPGVGLFAFFEPLREPSVGGLPGCLVTSV